MAAARRSPPVWAPMHPSQRLHVLAPATMKRISLSATLSLPWSSRAARPELWRKGCRRRIHSRRLQSVHLVPPGPRIDTQREQCVRRARKQTPRTRISFKNIHYFAAGATLFGDAAGRLPVRRAAVCRPEPSIRWASARTAMTFTRWRSSEACKACHGDTKPEDIRMVATDWDGDGNATEGVNRRGRYPGRGAVCRNPGVRKELPVRGHRLRRQRPIRTSCWMRMATARPIRRQGANRCLQRLDAALAQGRLQLSVQPEGSGCVCAQPAVRHPVPDRLDRRSGRQGVGLHPA